LSLIYGCGGGGGGPIASGKSRLKINCNFEIVTVNFDVYIKSDYDNRRNIPSGITSVGSASCWLIETVNIDLPYPPSDYTITANGIENKKRDIHFSFVGEKITYNYSGLITIPLPGVKL
jgi:hypothetical protein